MNGLGRHDSKLILNFRLEGVEFAFLQTFSHIDASKKKFVYMRGCVFSIKDKLRKCHNKATKEKKNFRKLKFEFEKKDSYDDKCCQQNIQ